MRENIKHLRTGIALVPVEFYRGLDVSFAVSSVVIVVLTIGKLTETEITQMAGRSNRKQGQGLCTLLYEERLLGLASNMIGQCRSNEVV